uniref:Uncharacterized protein n=1 Tax=Cynoglossus semilaevis TaxID=244447 RepID=A0A3P8VDC7_CYNSE
MDSFLSLGAPLKHFTSWVSTNKAPRKRGAKKSHVSRRRSLPCSGQKVPDSWLRVYQEELKRERKRQQALVAKKNSEKTVRKLNFRSHHCLPRVSQVRSIQCHIKTLSSSWLNTFTMGLSGFGTNAPPATTSAVGGDQCKVM